MTAKVPEDAFAYYFALGPERSYSAVGEHYGVSKRAITKRAAKEDWSGRLEAANQKAREKMDQSVVGSLEAMNERHLKVARAIQAKALDALRQMPLERAMDAVKALDIGVRQERLVLGEPSDRLALQACEQGLRIVLAEATPPKSVEIGAPIEP